MKKNLLRSLAIILINVLTVFLLFFLWGEKMQTASLKDWGILASIGAILQTVTILLFYKFVDKKTFNSLHVKMNKKDLLFSVISFVATISLFFIYIPLATKGEHFIISWDFQKLTSVGFYLILLLICFAWFTAALSEEVLYRWYLVMNLQHLGRGKLYLVTTLFFVLSHVFKGFDPGYLIFLIITGCCLMYVYLRTGGKIIPVTIAHMAQNLASGQIIGNTDLSILHFESELNVIHFMILTILYNLLIMVLSTVIYKKHEGLQFKSGKTISLLGLQQ
ncbi:CPBP family intramembrane glutamic endopeptidase [Neobacillus dielmonensis]|uniref:CPBP family intramembrane glutamic endopeptidase n=1 Tax=Neobacillus dielmonensis TaxID=1347369 RepID=UPI0005A9C7F6|nr:CPBP family intramembrane glutamic endopeptidase [Neobacillus dielmonensis]